MRQALVRVTIASIHAGECLVRTPKKIPGKSNDDIRANYGKGKYMIIARPMPNGEAPLHGLRELPDPEICRTREGGVLDPFPKCLVKCPVDCRYVLVYERGYICKFCRHPNWEAFVEPES